jgi:putative spermidine/putrescine transport system permease protein
MSAAPVSKAVAAHAIAPRASGRPWTFYVLLTVFVLYVLALYGPMICIYILSFQDVRGGLVFPMKGLSLHWFVDLFTQVRTGPAVSIATACRSACRSWRHGWRKRPFS